MATFQKKSSTDTAQDSGFSYKLLVRICGLVGIGSFFLAYFQGVNGLDFFKGIANVFSASGFEGVFTAISGGHDGGPALMTGLFLALGYIFFPLISLFMLLTGKYKGGPLTFLILFNLAGWLIIHFWGAEFLSGDLANSSFFGLTGPGYWLACGALLSPFIGMFFLDKSV